MYPYPCCKVWLFNVEKKLYCIFYCRIYIVQPSMVDPVSSRIDCEGKVLHSVFIDLVVQCEKYAKGSFCEDRVCRIGKNVVLGKGIPSFVEAIRCQILLDRKVREAD